MAALTLILLILPFSIASAVCDLTESTLDLFLEPILAESWPFAASSFLRSWSFAPFP